jgi:hypothetical protein
MTQASVQCRECSAALQYRGRVLGPGRVMLLCGDGIARARSKLVVAISQHDASNAVRLRALKTSEVVVVKSHRLVQGRGRATFYHTAAPLMPEACRQRQCVPFAH